MSSADTTDIAPECPTDTPAEARRLRGAYGLALCTVLLSIVFSIAFAQSTAGMIAVGLLQGVTLLVVLRVSGAHPRVRTVATAAAVVAVLVAIGVMYTDITPFQPTAPVIWGLIVLSAMAAIVRRVYRYEEVNVQTVLGLLTFYLLLGVLFGYLFAVVGMFQPFFNGGESDHASYVYFSFVTLSTTGYGDLTPAVGIPRAIAVGEAMSGQLYLVSVVSIAVGRIAGSAKRGLNR